MITIDVLLRLSGGEISLMEATYDLGLQDAGYTLHALKAAGLRPFQLEESVVQAQAAAALEPLRSALKAKPIV